MRLLRNNKGITLIDTVVTMMIIAMIGTAMLSTLTQSLRGWSKGTATEAASSAATIAIQRLAYEIREARSASASGSGATAQLTVTFPKSVTDPTSGEQLYDPSLNDLNVRVYSIVNGNLVKTINGATSIVAKGNLAITTLQASGGDVDIIITSQKQYGTTVCSAQAQAHISLRNH